jgi:copper chaperone
MIQLKIDGMSCLHCVKAVSDVLSRVPGVTQVREVDLDAGLATVEGAPDPMALVAAVKEAGYQATISA